ncbi:MAG: GNAT family N-acetyltransferase [Defluviitaleaceae bacterium]|nr:GNAT family N-acetyltransferase [Defluviitaleaceae bacterium]
MNLTFEMLLEEDIPQLKEILGRYMESPQQVREFVSEKQNIAIVAKLDGKVVGLVYGYFLTCFHNVKPQFFIYSVDIHEKYQGKGCGTKFMRHVVDWARDNGFSESFVMTDESNSHACKVYKKAGMTNDEADATRVYEVHYK